MGTVEALIVQIISNQSIIPCDGVASCTFSALGLGRVHDRSRRALFQGRLNLIVPVIFNYYLYMYRLSSLHSCYFPFPYGECSITFFFRPRRTAMQDNRDCRL